MLIFCLLASAVLLVPESAHAWGPVTHLAHGTEVLRSLNTLGQGLQQLLSRFPAEYLYGCVGADITFAKKYTRAMQAHCHSWHVGWQILEAAGTEAERAFAYGYLTHLAGDVFSHNHFVPTQLVVGFRSRALGHAYWEARFDTLQSREYWELVSEVRRRPIPDCDRLVKRVVARTIFSFRTNKRIFNSFLAFHDWKNWQEIMKRVSDLSRYPLAEALVPLYNDTCYRHALDVLLHGRRAKCQKADPTGEESLELAKQVRRSLKALRRQKALTPSIRNRLASIDRRADLGEAGGLAVPGTFGAPG